MFVEIVTWYHVYGNYQFETAIVLKHGNRKPVAYTVSYYLKLLPA